MNSPSSPLVHPCMAPTLPDPDLMYLMVLEHAHELQHDDAPDDFAIAQRVMNTRNTMRRFTVGQLKKLIADMPDSAPVLRPGSDHSYHEALVTDGTAAYGDRSFWEWHGVENASDGEKPVRALIVR